MTTFAKWVDLSITILKDSLDILKEHLDNGNIELYEAQKKTLQDQFKSFDDYVHRMEKFPK